jgi:hypothetical protein
MNPNSWVARVSPLNRTLFRRVVVQVRAEPALDLGYGHAFALGVVGDLVAVDLAEREIARLGVGEVEAAHARSGPHRKRLGNHHAGVGLDVEQAPERALLGVIGAGGIAGGGADAAILLVDEVVDGGAGGGAAGALEAFDDFLGLRRESNCRSARRRLPCGARLPRTGAGMGAFCGCYDVGQDATMMHFSRGVCKIALSDAF